MESSCNVEEPEKRAHWLVDPGSGFSVVLDSPESGLEAQSSLKPRPPISSRYKGVVPQPNGRWGAQIYEKHRRVWLGTFTRQSDAAAAYDAASRRFRGPHAAANFRTAADAAELAFLESHSKAEIVDMLRKHTYEHELLQSKRAFGGQTPVPASLASSGPHKILFEKAVTPSDVGKLNRLVIPKQHAEKYFPATDGGVLVNFEDPSGRVWRFRYSYWGSSQSYVLTKGWSRFVKEHSLKAGDVVSFQQSAGMERKLFIACRRGDSVETSRPAEIFRLFGVNIAVGGGGGGGGLDCGSTGKRMREEYWLKPPHLCKKQCIGNLK